MFWAFVFIVFLLCVWEIYLRRKDPPGPDFWD